MNPEQQADVTVAAADAAYKQGALDQRLNTMDLHFKVINGSIADTAAALTNMNLELLKMREVLVARLETKADRERLHEIQATLSAIELRLAALDAISVKKDGPIISNVMEYERKIDVLAASQGTVLAKLKEELKEEIVKNRDEVKALKMTHVGSLRRAAAFGSAFAIGMGVVLAGLNAAGIT